MSSSDHTLQLLHLILNGQNELKHDLLTKLDQVEKNLDKLLINLIKKTDKVTKRLDRALNELEKIVNKRERS